MKPLPTSLISCFILFMSLTACAPFGNHGDDHYEGTPTPSIVGLIPGDPTFLPGGRLRVEAERSPLAYIILKDADGNLTTVPRSSAPLGAIHGDSWYTDFDLSGSLGIGTYYFESPEYDPIHRGVPYSIEIREGEMMGLSGPVEVEIAVAELDYFDARGDKCWKNRADCIERVRVELQTHLPDNTEPGWSVLVLNEDETQFSSLYEINGPSRTLSRVLIFSLDELVTPYCFTLRVGDPEGGVETQPVDDGCLDLEELRAEQGCKGGNTAFLAYFPFLGLLRRRRRRRLE